MRAHDTSENEHIMYWRVHSKIKDSENVDYNYANRIKCIPKCVHISVHIVYIHIVYI